MESWAGVDGSKSSLLFDYLVNLIQTGQANSFGNTYQQPEEFLWYREDSHEYFFDNHLILPEIVFVSAIQELEWWVIDRQQYLQLIKMYM